MARILKEEKLLRPGEEKISLFLLLHPKTETSLESAIKSARKPEGCTPGNAALPSLRKKMTFYAQRNSVNDENAVEDGGMIYVFYCFSCGEVHALAQSY